MPRKFVYQIRIKGIGLFTEHSKKASDIMMNTYGKSAKLKKVKYLVYKKSIGL